MNIDNLENSLTQCEFILKTMYDNRDNKRVWYAKDFQYGEHFVGYEASARMSDLVRMFPDIFIVAKDGRFRTLELNLEEEDMIKKLLGIGNEK